MNLSVEELLEIIETRRRFQALQTGSYALEVDGDVQGDGSGGAWQVMWALYPGFSEKQVQRKMCQDAFVVSSLPWPKDGLLPAELKETTSHYLLGLFDGHGMHGHYLTDALVDLYPDILLEEVRRTSKAQVAFQRSYKRVHKELDLNPNVEMLDSGTTATTCIMSSTHLFMANVGDSRAILCSRDPKTGRRVVKAMTAEHNCDDAAEVKRVLKSGGEVRQGIFDGEAAGPKRVYIKDEEKPGLCVTRSIGDKVGHRVGVIATPFFTQHELTEFDDYLVIASDGIWDRMSNMEVAQRIDARQYAVETPGEIVRECGHRWFEGNSLICDDITLLVVMLRPEPPSWEALYDYDVTERIKEQQQRRMEHSNPQYQSPEEKILKPEQQAQVE